MLLSARRPSSAAQETCTALVTSLGSFLGIPLSTTQTHTGSTTGVGLAENRKGAVKWSLLAKMFAGWVITLFVGGLLSAAIFSWGEGGAQTGRSGACATCRERLSMNEAADRTAYCGSVRPHAHRSGAPVTHATQACMHLVCPAPSPPFSTRRPWSTTSTCPCRSSSSAT